MSGWSNVRKIGLRQYLSADKNLWEPSTTGSLAPLIITSFIFCGIGNSVNNITESSLVNVYGIL
jgi:hypothetical protein